ncbi:hypothetical protein [Streptomyces ochraceiscleroticus]|uniref:Secreted protein n=1 Tax=Streptomyces ochraceiscleroticus TaxID=47761 RepID=A0ABW1MMM0_9ACTN|nr:hypothetical protein [Streptomyces ochraceiscleroticus]
MKLTATGMKATTAAAVMVAALTVPAATSSPSVTAYAAGAPSAPTTRSTGGAPAASAVPPGLSCDTGKHANDEYTGYALCRNNGGAPQTFWVHLVCGWAPDVDGEHVTLNPGQSGQSTAHCGSLGTGIGEISVQP